MEALIVVLMLKTRARESVDVIPNSEKNVAVPLPDHVPTTDKICLLDTVRVGVEKEEETNMTMLGFL